MGLPQVPPGLKDQNLANFLRQIRNAIAGVSDNVTRLEAFTRNPGNSGGATPADPGATDPGNPGTPGTPAPTVVVTLTISPLAPKDGDDITLMVSVAGDQPTGSGRITKNSEDLITLSLSGGSATYVIAGGLATGTYTFVAYYSGDPRNPAAVSNTVTLEVGSSWAGRPAPPSSLAARWDMSAGSISSSATTPIRKSGPATRSRRSTRRPTMPLPRRRASPRWQRLLAAVSPSCAGTMLIWSLGRPTTSGSATSTRNPCIRPGYRSATALRPRS